jgi:hypothetical protein
MTKRKLVLLAALIALAGCGSGPNIFTAFEQQYWRIDTQGPDGKWQTNWKSWFDTEEACLKELSENQRCRKRRL